MSPQWACKQSFHCSDQEEFLYLLNIITSKKSFYYYKSQKLNIEDQWLADQSWLNEVYRWEWFDVGPQYNMQPLIAQQKRFDILEIIAQQYKMTMSNVVKNIYIQNATVIHFSGISNKGWFIMNNCKEPILTVCNIWKNYSERLPWKFVFDSGYAKI